MQEFDMIVIGAGRGHTLATNAAQKGKKVALIEKSKLGGTCPNRGCVPSKLLIGYAHVARAVKNSSRHFIDSSINSINVSKMFQKTNEYIAQVDPTTAKELHKNITLFREEASFLNDKTIKAGSAKLTAPTIVIATGTRPKKPAHEKAWTSDDIFPFQGEVPKSIAIVGAGLIACELANFFDAVGIKTKLLVRSQRLLSNEDEEVSALFKEEFSKKIDIDFDTTIDSMEYKNNAFHLKLINKDKTTKSHTCEALMYAIGREPNSDILKLENTSIEVDEKGFIKRDEFLQTTTKGVYVIGDVAGEYQLLHAASYEARHLSEILLENSKKPLSFKYMPHAVFTDPEIASVGITEEEAKKQGIEYVAHTSSWQASAMARAKRIEYPITKFILNPKTFEILGCHMVGPESSTLIHQVLTLLHVNNDIRYLKEMMYIHPALSEVIMAAAIKSIKECEEWNS